MNTEASASSGSIQKHKEYLVNDLRRIVGDADDLLKEIGNVTAEEWATTRRKFERQLNEASARVNSARVMLRRRAGEAVEAGGEYVRENPWKVAVVASLIGVLCAVLLKRRTSGGAD